MSTETRLSSVEEFIRAFLEMDADNNEMIDKQELIKYCQKNRLDMRLIDVSIPFYMFLKILFCFIF